MHSCKFCGGYLRNHKHIRDFQKIFPWLIYTKVCLPVSRFFNRITRDPTDPILDTGPVQGRLRD